MINYKFKEKTFHIDGPLDDESVTRIVRDTGTYEDWIWSNVTLLLEPNDICIDIGANIGLAAIVLCSHCFAGHVYAFEPHPILADYIEKNLSRNFINNVTVYRMGLGSSAGCASLVVSAVHNGLDYGGGVTVREDTPALGAQLIDIQLVDMDGWVSKMKMDRINLIKIDVEGFELDILRGAESTIERFRPKVVIEYFPEKLRRHGVNKDYELAVLLLGTFPYVYQIDRLTNKLVRIGSYAHLRAQMMTGHGVEDLLCDWNPIPREIEGDSADLSSYESSHVQLYASLLSIVFLSHFRDGWICGRQFVAVVINSGSEPTHMRFDVLESSCDNTLYFYVENELTTLHCEVGIVQFSHEFTCNCGYTVVYGETASSVNAASYFNNEDPRNISARVCLSISSL